MARVTVEDCLDNVENRFELVLVSSKRARQLARGQDAKVDWEQDKPTVVALREIAEGFITNEILNEPEIDDRELAGLQFLSPRDAEIAELTRLAMAEDEESPVTPAASSPGEEPAEEL